MEPFTSYITAQELSDKPSTLAQLHDILGRFTPESLIQVTSWLAIGARVHAMQPEFSHQVAWVDKHLPRVLAERIRGLSENGSRPVFSRSGILTTARESIRVGDPKGVSADSAVGVQQVMLAVLIAQDLVRAPPLTDKRIELVAAILPYFIANPRGNELNAIARSLLMIETLSERRRGSAGFADVAALFQSATDLSVREYSQLMIAACTRYIKSDEAAIFAGGITLKIDYFGSSKISPRIMRDVLDGISRPVEEFRPKIAQNPLSADFFEFEDRPLLRLPGGEWVCIDIRSMLKKAGSGLFWTMHAHHGMRDDVKRFWGQLFEDYVEWLLKPMDSGTGLSVLKEPRFSDGATAGDVCIFDDHRIAILELKSATMPRGAKEGDPLVLEKDLAVKVIEGGKNRKGVAQLLNTQSRLAKGQGIHGVPATKHKRKFYPCLIFLDEAYASIGIKAILADAFRQQRVRNGAVKTTKLFALTIEDLEYAVNHVDQTDFFALFEEYYREDRGMSLPLAMMFGPNRASKSHRTHHLDLVLKQLLDEARGRFFDEPPYP